MNWKAVWLKVISPPVWLKIVLSIVSVTSLVVIFVKGWSETVPAYICYAVAFYTLGIVVYAVIGFIKDARGRLKEKIFANKYVKMFFTDVAFKTHVTLYPSFTINLVYATVNVIFGIVYSTAWFIIFAVYYGILATMRFLLLSYVKKNRIGEKRILEYRRSRLCAMILMTVNLVLSGAVLMMAYRDKGFEYYGFLIYVMALYTFYATINAIINLVKYRRYKSPIMSTAKIINLAAALFSMLALETAMLSQFGGETSMEYKQIMIMSTGAGISVVVVVMSIYSIIRANIEIKKLKINNSET